jgi:hypothetical protein
MAEKLDPKEIVSVEEVIMVQAIESEALLNVLEKKGIITKDEVLVEINKLREEYMK